MSDPADLARRRSLLVAALVALRVKASMPELEMMHRWLDNRAGVATGWSGRDTDWHLTNAEAGIWRATFSRHPMTSGEGFGGSEMARGEGNFIIQLLSTK